jgi:hypothetical protein
LGRYLCPTCSGGTRVIETRLSSDRIKRRRACEQDHRFNTLEVPADSGRKLKELIDWLSRQSINSEIVDYGKAQIDTILLGTNEEE